MTTKTIIPTLITSLLLFPYSVMAQFNTIQKNETTYIILDNTHIKNPNFQIDKVEADNKSGEKVSDNKEFKRIREKSQPKNSRSKVMHKNSPVTDKLKGLTLESLYAEIIKNNIQHPKIVLAQAVLETGWFKSSVCRNKGNLFGLKNPRTHDYYNFNDWRESVKAYYDKVQYRFKGGNYLLWLKKIGYAEDKGYIEAVMRVLKQL